MDNIILYLLTIIQEQYQQICWLILFICKYIPLKQWAHDEIYSPKYQKFKTDELPLIEVIRKNWDWDFLIDYYRWREYPDYPNVKTIDIKPIKRRKACDISEDTVCPCCGAPMPYLYKNNGAEGQLLCKVCNTAFSPDDNRFNKEYTLRCPHCGHALVHKKSRAVFNIHKCVNKKCPYYLKNLKKVKKEDLAQDYGKNKYKLHYIYREFTFDFFKVDLTAMPKNFSSLKFRKHDSHVMSLCLTMHVNLQLSLRKTSQALKDLYGIQISHQQVANYARTAAVVIKPFVDNYNYQTSKAFTADETYIKVRGIKGYIWFIMDVASRAIIGYRVSDNRSVGPCILAMRQAFQHLKKLPKGFRFIADGYSAYPLAAQLLRRKLGKKFKFKVTQVIGLTNDDAVSTEYRPYKQMIERLNRTFKSSYRVACGYDNFEGANYNVSLWVAYYNFLKPHKYLKYKPPVELDILQGVDNAPGKWQVLLYLGEKTILELGKQQAAS